MSSVWAQGTYKVKPGCADEFVRLWGELARQAVEEFGVPPPTILRDRDDPDLFVTSGVWDSLDTLQRFRSSPLVAERAVRWTTSWRVPMRDSSTRRARRSPGRDQLDLDRPGPAVEQGGEGLVVPLEREAVRDQRTGIERAGREERHRVAPGRP